MRSVLAPELPPCAGARGWRDEEKAASVKGRPLRCRACEGTLILNALALRQHLASKRHRRGMKGDTLLPVPRPKPSPACCGASSCCGQACVHRTLRNKALQLRWAERGLGL